MLRETSFDVKISIVHPHLTRTMPGTDSAKISTNTLFKYTAQKALNTSTSEMVEEPAAVISAADLTQQIMEKAKEVRKQYSDIERVVDERLKGLVQTYSLADPDDANIAESEEYIFGTSTGAITYQQYDRCLDLVQDVAQEIQRRARAKAEEEANVG